MNTDQAKLGDSKEDADDMKSTVASNDACPVAAAADRLAKPMFCLSLLFLLLLAGLVVAWVDILPDSVDADLASIPQDRDLSDFSSGDFWHEPALHAGYVLLGTLLSIWPLFLLEPLYVRWLSWKQGRGLKSGSSLDWVCVACPPLRLAKLIPAKDGEIWLPRLGWHPPGKPLHKCLERIFSKPMLIIAMLVLPVLIIEFRYQELLRSTLWLKLLLSISMGLIWCAFTCEFILMVSSTNKKLAYIKKNWIDLAIILLPLVSFLRSLRVFRAAKLARFSKMGRVYRMRGLFAKTIRAFLVFELIHRILKTKPEKRLEKLLEQVEEKEEELRELQHQVATVRAELDSQEQAQPFCDATENQSLPESSLHSESA